MNEPEHQASDLDPLVREAIALVVRLTSGTATTVDAAEIKRWRAQSLEHEEAFREAVKLWRSLGQAAKQVAHVEAPRRHTMLLDRTMARRAFIGGAIAAAGAGYLIVRPPLDLWPSYKELLADYRTAKGEQRRVAPSPGVSVELGTLTSLSVRSSGEAPPSIELISGEAAFTAKTSKGAPMTLVAADGQVTATDASFNARCIDGIVSVTCLSGSVEVESHAQSASLKPGQQVVYTPAGLGSVADVDVDKATSWRSGLLVFNDMPLADVISEVNRYRRGRIVITNDTLAHRVVNATVRRDQLDTFIAQIQQLFGAKVTNLPAGLLLLS